MENKDKAPGIFSKDFHLKFFPALLWRFLHQKNRRYESTFHDRFGLELPVMAVVCLVLMVYGFSAVMGTGSILGWGCGIAGLAGFGYLLAHSIRSAASNRPSFDFFRVIIFLFFVFFGLTAGLETGNVHHVPYGVKIVMGLGGAVAGYVVGIPAGLFSQCLGWMASLLDVIALAGIAVMIFLDILLLM